MSRCDHHRVIEPCIYCRQGQQPFHSTVNHLDAIEDRLRNLERQEQAVPPPKVCQLVVSEEKSSPAPKPGTDLSQTIGVVRDYALGDLVMLSASLKALKEKNLERPLVLITRPELMDVLAGAPYLDAQFPKHSHENANFFKKYDLCGAVETEAGGKLDAKTYLSKPRPDIFAEKLGVPGGAEYFPIPVNPAALYKMQTILSGCKPPIIGVAPTCNSNMRVMPMDYVTPLVQSLIKSYGGTVVLLGKTKNWSKRLTGIKLPQVINLIDSLSVGELIAAVSLLHAIISPDTGTMHIAGALGVKCLCVMGNNNPKNFSDFYPSVKTIQAKELSCVPCNDRSIPCAPLSPGQYGAACMQAMTPERVHGEFKKFYNGKNIAYLHDTPLDYVGGAEITTKGMIKAGREMGYNVRLFDRNTPPEQLYSLYGYDLIILSNIWRLPKSSMNIVMQAIRNRPYVKYEHDHDGLGESPQGYSREHFAEKIYAGADLNVFVSPAHQKDYQNHFVLSGKVVSIPELIDVEMFKPVAGVKRVPGSALIAVPGKWGQAAIDRYIKDNPNLKVTVLDQKVLHSQMPDLYSRHEILAHFPQRKWPCDRVVYEAALCGCKIQAGDIVEALSWGKDMTDREDLAKWLKDVPKQFWNTVRGLISG